MPKFQAVAFDFDGVLADTTSLHVDAWNSTLSKFGIDRSISANDILGLSVREFAESLDIEQRLVGPVIASKRELVQGIATIRPPELYPHVASTLKNLHCRYRLAVVSVGEKAVVLSTVRHFDIESFFDLFVLEGDYTRPKPHPEPYNVCLSRLRLEPEEVVAIEDSLAGIEAAKAAGLFVIAVSTNAAVDKLQQADHVIDHIGQLSNFMPIE